MMMNEQIISLAQVVDVVDVTRNGSFTATIDYLGNLRRSVHYVSPYGSNTEGAFVAIPSVGTTILVCKLAGSEAGWYYLGTTFTKERNQVEGDPIKEPCFPLERVLPRMYRSRGIPKQMAFLNPIGAGLTISDEDTEKYMNKSTELKSSTNKTVSLIDSPGIDSIIIDSGNNSKITVSNDPQNQSVPAQAVQIETAGPQKYLNSGSQTDIFVGEGGKELQLLNKGNGVGWGDAGPCGNVNIQSYKKDVNVFTKAEEGRIFIECLNESGSNQVIEIQTNGEGGAIRIKTSGKVDISASSIGINATDNIDIKAKNIKMEATEVISIKATGNINADGKEIQLNGGLSTPADPGIGNTESYYGNVGVTTY